MLGSERSRLFIFRLTGICCVGSFFISPPTLELESYTRLMCDNIGLLLVVICMQGRIWSSLFIGGRKDFEVVTFGPYAVVRHPLYLFTFFGAAGFALTCPNFSVSFVLLAFVIGYSFRVMKAEEERLIRIFGDVYLKYQQKTPMIIPRSWIFYSELRRVRIKTHVVWKSFCNEMWFVCFYVFLLMIRKLTI